MVWHFLPDAPLGLCVYDYTAYMDNMDFNVPCPRKAVMSDVLERQLK